MVSRLAYLDVECSPGQVKPIVCGKNRARQFKLFHKNAHMRVFD